MKNSYGAAMIEDSIKDTLVKLYLVQEESGMTRTLFREQLKQAGYEVSRATFDRWIASVKKGQPCISPTKASSGKRILTDEIMEVVCGFTLARCSVGKQTSIDDLAGFIQDTYDIKASHPTIRRNMGRMRFSYQSMLLKSGGFKVSREEEQSMVWDWVKNARTDGILEDDRSKVASVDFTFTSHRKDTKKSWGPVGAATRDAGSLSSYTNCIMTMIWADGVNRTGPVMFTSNPKFNMEGRGRNADRARLKRLLTALGLFECQVQYLGHLARYKKKYVSESFELVKMYFDIWEATQDMSDVTVLSDNGSAFFPSDGRDLTSLGCKKHVAYPALVHQYLSPNDNAMHGAAKQSWRNAGLDYKDDVESSLTLLQLLDVEGINGDSHFDRNMYKLKRADVPALVNRGKSWDSEHHAEYLWKYRMKVGECPIGDQTHLPKRIRTNLDGGAWQ